MVGLTCFLDNIVDRCWLRPPQNVGQHEAGHRGGGERRPLRHHHHHHLQDHQGRLQARADLQA